MGQKDLSEKILEDYAQIFIRIRKRPGIFKYRLIQTQRRTDYYVRCFTRSHQSGKNRR